MPQASVRHSIAPTPEIPSTAKTAGVSATTLPIASTGWPVPGRGLAQRAHDADGVGVLLQGLGDLVGVDRLAPLGVERHGVDAVRLADAAPPRREVAGVQDQRLAARRHRVDRRRLHRARCPRP